MKPRADAVRRIAPGPISSTENVPSGSETTDADVASIATLPQASTSAPPTGFPVSSATTWPRMVPPGTRAKSQVAGVAPTSAAHISGVYASWRTNVCAVPSGRVIR